MRVVELLVEHHGYRNFGCVSSHSKPRRLRWSAQALTQVLKVLPFAPVPGPPEGLDPVAVGPEGRKLQWSRCSAWQADRKAGVYADTTVLMCRIDYEHYDVESATLQK